MKNTFRAITIFILLLNACSNEEQYVFKIAEPSQQKNDLLFLAESTNIAKIPSDSTLYYLAKEEILSAEKRTFKSFGKIHSDEEFDAYILLKEGSDTGRDYTFILRAYDKNFHVIDSHELAVWIESENRFCFGSIDQDLMIRKTCQGEEGENIKQIRNDGYIVK